jgi:hypothetical protein
MTERNHLAEEPEEDETEPDLSAFREIVHCRLGFVVRKQFGLGTCGHPCDYPASCLPLRRLGIET